MHKILNIKRMFLCTFHFSAIFHKTSVSLSGFFAHKKILNIKTAANPSYKKDVQYRQDYIKRENRIRYAGKENFGVSPLK